MDFHHRDAAKCRRPFGRRTALVTTVVASFAAALTLGVGTSTSTRASLAAPNATPEFTQFAKNEVTPASASKQRRFNIDQLWRVPRVF